jgi:quercetin dioxygenase-like cupin family protein
MSFFRAADTGPAYWGPGDIYTFLATGEETNGEYFVMEGLVPPNAGPPPHIHHDAAETFYIVDGQVEVKLGDKVHQAKAGDFVHISKGTPHAFFNRSRAPAKMVLTFVPAGIEKFFEEAFKRATDRHGTPPPITEEFIRHLLGTAQRYDSIQFLPPPEAGPEGAA